MRRRGGSADSTPLGPRAVRVAAFVALAVFTGAPRAARAQENPAIVVLEGASARYAKATSLCADFDQTLSVPLLEQENKGSGRLCQTQPNRFAMRFDDPAGDAVVIDGSYVWIYYKSQDPGTVFRMPVADAPGGFDFHREFLEHPAEKYVATEEGAERVAGHDTYRIRLVPRTHESYVSAVVWVDKDDHLLRQVRVEDENQSVRTVTLKRISLDPKIPEGWFTFTPPPGAQIISR